MDKWRPSYGQGFAHSASESMVPWRWHALRALYVPSLGQTSSTVFDWAGRRRDGTLDANAVWAQTPVGPSVDTTAGGISLPGPLVTNATNQFTIAVSFVLDTLAVSDYIYSQELAALHIRNQNTFFVFSISGATLFTSAHGLSAGDRVHLVWSVTQSPDHQFVWCNGQQLADESSPFIDWGAATGTAKIGNIYTGAANYLPGKFSFFAYYDRAWTRQEAMEFFADPYEMLWLWRPVHDKFYTRYTIDKVCHAEATAGGTMITRDLVVPSTIVCIATVMAGLNHGAADSLCQAQVVAAADIEHRQTIHATAVASADITRDVGGVIDPCVASVVASAQIDYSQPSTEEWQIFHATGDAPMDYGNPIETYTSVPHTTSATFLTPGKNRFVIRKRNAYGFNSRNQVEKVIWVDDDGDAIAGGQPSKPQEASISQLRTDHVLITAVYDGLWDSPYPAKGGFEGWTTYDGSEPSPGTPDSAASLYFFQSFIHPVPPGINYEQRWGLILSDPPDVFNNLPTGTVVKMRTRVIRNASGTLLYSDLTDTVSVTINNDGPAAPPNLGIDYYQQDGDD